ncbi:MAG: tetratricopeptide repeat protein [Verrucomicrobiia bacterium]
MKNAWRFLAAVCMLVIGAYAYMAEPGAWESLTQNAADAYYNLLVQGFRAGQLNLKKEAPLGLTQLADPYDPAANFLYRIAPYRLHDLSYYKGRLYLYSGVTPALILFWPFVALTGHYLFHSQAVVFFCAMGFLASVGLLHALSRRYFAEVSAGVVAACALALGLATSVPALLSWSDVYEVAISCGYMLTMLALAAIWCALHEPRKRSGWLAAASVAYGLAVGARPSLLFGAVILLVPVAQAWRERHGIWALLMAAMGPITLIGLGLMLYNSLRFNDPFEFGVRYLLAPVRQQQYFSLRYLWFNFRVYFLEPARWSGRFPFVHAIAPLPLPPGHYGVEGAFGILTNIPLVWLALAVPLAWRGRSAEAGAVLRWFITAATLLFGTCALTLGFFWAAISRYEVEFLPALLLLAVVGILGLERALADRRVWRCAARWGWGLLLGFSVAFNLLAWVQQCAEEHLLVGRVLRGAGRMQEAIGEYEQALRLKPDYVEAHENLAAALVQLGNVPEAMEHWEQVLRIKPDRTDAHNNLGLALMRQGRLQEAIQHYEQALRIKPDLVEAHDNLAAALVQLGNVPEAMEHWEQVLRIKPDRADAHNNLGVALMGQGRLQEAIQHYEQALRIKPDFAEAHCNLGIALEQAGRPQDAIGHYQQALRLNPDLAEARNALARLQAGQ